MALNNEENAIELLGGRTCLINLIMETFREFLETIALGVTFFGYLFCGAYILSLYEPELDFFKAFYFNFITVTTVGLGDFVPKRETYLLVTIAYITLGLALTTLTFDIAAQYLRKVHYFGRKIENVANAVIWFGGKKMSLKSLVRHLGDHFNIPLDELNNLNLDTFVDAAIKVEAGEIKTLRVCFLILFSFTAKESIRYFVERQLSIYRLKNKIHSAKVNE
ncbi:unnamed protein product [Toxocara canis]|uniref:Ion_trans_2 domain-containing protein n=1 Tax=Toxocara canis TaxID=6265 RepID=A0A183VE88_TOXCA|nr:unnamed protein product [Toxocara canis]